MGFEFIGIKFMWLKVMELRVIERWAVLEQHPTRPFSFGC